MIIQNVAYTVSAPTVPKEYDRKFRDIVIFFDKGNSVVKIYDALRYAAYPGTFAFITARGIIADRGRGD